MEPTPTVAAYSSLVDVVRHQAAVRPDHVALVFLPDGETEVGRLTYGELDRRARLFAARLQEQELAGQCVLLMLPSSIYYVVAFLGSLYAGAIPVPVYPPTSSMHAERLANIVRDCDAKSVILTTAGQHDSVHAKLDQFFPEGLSCAQLSIDEKTDLNELDWVEPALRTDSLAYLQYTSGSTSEPRGVMVTHANLLEHARHLQAALKQDQNDVFVNWLPLFHDMGLISGVIQPLCLGATTVMMPSMAFLQKPLRWLSAISRYRGTTSFAPNFAYELCAAALDETIIKTLDLSTWAIAMNGAEPVRASTIQKFRERFAPCGFRPEAMNPGYGLAETTLTVTCGEKQVLPSICKVNSDALEQNRFIPVVSENEKGRTLVGCGQSRLGIQTVIVDPETAQMCADGEVGEIWVAGPIVAAGYWQRPNQTATTFHAHLRNGAGPFLRTGDLGVLHNGELYISGRIKDLIVIRGRNHYPQDIEHTVCKAHPAAEIGHGVVFSVEVGSEEKLVVVQDIRRSWRKRFDGKEVAEAIRKAVSAHHGLRVHALLLLNPTSVHITTSGKVQRQSCKADYLSDRFEPLYAWSENTVTVDSPPTTTATAQAKHSELNHQNFGAIVSWIRSAIAFKKAIPVEDVDPAQSFSSFGLDSLELVSLSGELSSWLKQQVEPIVFYDYPNAHVLAQRLSGQQLPTPPVSSISSFNGRDPIAIIGMACRLPGAASVDAYWDLLERGDNAIAEIPDSRWPVDAYYVAGAIAPGKMNTRWGGLIDRMSQFDAYFFGISPREAQSMDPQQRVLLETVWHALEDAGVPPDSLAGSKTGVFIGISTNDYHHMQRDHQVGIDTYSGTGNAASIAANRISYFLDLRGPSLAIDTACSSSLVAVHQARMSLNAGECDMAIVGGVNLVLSPDNTIVFSQAQMMAADGQCKTFDASADGYVRSEGCGVVILKRLGDANGHHDCIAALITGSAINQDGKSNGLTAPNGLAQQEVMREALTAASIDATRVSYIEAHGTGTALGDPIEVNAINSIYGARADCDNTGDTLWIGSVKPNIGHLEAAAGIAGLIKVVLAMKHRRIPPHLHFRELNPGISFENTRCAITTYLQEWPKDSHPRTAGVSSFGFGGTNAHVIVQETLKLPQEEKNSAPAPVVESDYQLLVLSAKDEPALHDLAAAYAEFLPQQSTAFSSICDAAAGGRSHHASRLAIVADSKQEAADMLVQYCLGIELPNSYNGVATQAARGHVAFLFTGQGSQYARMGQTLFRTHSGFRQRLERCASILQPLLGCSLLDILAGEEDIALAQTAYAQPALFSIEYALTAVWESAGLVPDYLSGHSVGEYVAACIAGVFSLEDGLKLVANRGRLMHENTEPGAMVAVHAPAPFIEAFLESFETRQTDRGDISLAAKNSPEDIVLSGTRGAIEAEIAVLAGTDAAVTRLNVCRAFHSPLMQTMLAEFRRCAETVSYHPPKLPVISNMTGKVAPPDIASAEYWVRHVSAPVLFSESLLTLETSGCRTFVEIGPQPVLTEFGLQTIPNGVWLQSLRRGHHDEHQLLRSMGKLYVAGGAIDWKRWLHERRGASSDYKHTELPLYPFQNDRFWFQSQLNKPVPVPTGQAVLHPLLGHRLEIAGASGHRFECELSTNQPWFIDQHRLFGVPVLPAAATVEWALAALLHGTGKSSSGVVLNNLQLQSAMILSGERRTRTQIAIEEHGDAYRLHCFGRDSDSLDGAWYEHATLDAQYLSEQSEAIMGDIAELQNTLTPRSVGACYEYWRERGLNYGLDFKGMRALWQSGNQALARIEAYIPSSDANTYWAHPIVLDACFHALFVFPHMANDKTVLLPVAINRLIAYRRLPANLWCKIIWHGEQTQNRYVADLALFSENSELVAEIDGLQLAMASRSAIVQSARDLQPESYGIKWEPIAAHALMESTSIGPWLIYCSDAGQARAIQAELSGREYRLLLPAQHGIGDETAPTHIHVDVDSEHDLEQVFSTLRREHDQVQGLLFWDALGVQQVDPDHVVGETYALAKTSFLLIKHFLAAYSHISPEVIICSRGAHVVSIEEGELNRMTGVGLAQSALTGMTKAVISEYSLSKCVQVDLDPSMSLPSVSAVLNGVSRIEGSGHIAQRAGHWYEARLTIQSLTAQTDGCSAIRSDASYLITGGLGALGLKVAEWLVENGAQHLILISRSKPVKKPEAIRQLERRGAHVVVLQADIAEEVPWQELSSQLENAQPPLRGIVHAAGSIDDSVIDRLDWPRFAGVMNAKVRGAWNLHLLSERLELDFLTLFSSFVAVIGSPGQSNYIVANTFLDSLAHYRRQRGMKASSINWGPWIEGGMAAQNDGLERLALQGIHGILNESGLQAFSDLSASESVVGVARVDWHRYLASQLRKHPYTLLTHVAHRPDAVNQHIASTENALGFLMLPSVQWNDVLGQYLLKMIARVLQLGEIKQTELQATFSQRQLNELGLDSLMAIELRNKIMTELSVDVPIHHFIGGSTVENVVLLIKQQLMLRKVMTVEEESESSSADREVCTL